MLVGNTSNIHYLYQINIIFHNSPFVYHVTTLAFSKVRTNPREVIIETRGGRREHRKSDGTHSMLARGKRDARGEGEEEGAEWYDDGEVWRKEAMKALCNVIYNSQRAQERASALG